MILSDLTLIEALLKTMNEEQRAFHAESKAWHERMSTQSKLKQLKQEQERERTRLKFTRL